MKRIIPFLLLAILIIPSFSVTASSGSIPTFKIDEVMKGESVTITTHNFPADDTFNVLMGKIGTRGVAGTLVTTQVSNTGGSFTATYSIPESLKNDYLIAIRLESPTSGYYAFNWFYNNTTNGDPAPSPTPTPSPDPFVIPTFRITDVEKNASVTIETKNFPADDKFTVTMGYMGTRGVDGIVVGTKDSGDGGVLAGTYDIPAEMKDQYRIAIRMESPTTGYYAYNWFYNNTTGTVAVPPPPAPAPSVFTIPTFSIIGVAANSTVTIETKEFPTRDTFTVTMGVMGTRGVNGIVVDTQDSGDGGSFTATYNIPEDLKGHSRIAIRLESASSGLYSYNWFYNNNAP